MPDSFKYRLKKLPITQKLILVGSFLAIIGVFLPWYRDIDRFNIGDSFLGITGPLYLAGFLVLVAFAVSFGVVMFKLLGKTLPKLPMKEKYLHILSGALSIFLLILAASVYFHPKFGINLTDKSVGIGMIFGFIGSSLVLLASILNGKVKEVDFDMEGHLEPLIEMTEREPSSIDTRPKDKIELNKEATIEEAMRASRVQEGSGKSWGPVQESISNYKSDKDHTNDIR